MSLIALKTELRQQLKLTPQLMQSMEVLQMNSQELLEYLGRLTEENPLLEREDVPDLRDAYQELRQKAVWIDAGLPGASFSHEGALPERGAVDRETESLAAFLRDQLERKRLPKPLLALGNYLAELVDEDGYLAEEDLEGLSELNIPQPLIDEALAMLQGLEPAGVGARSLPECLLLQLDRRGNRDPGLREIVRQFLPDIGKKHYGPIANTLGLSLEEVQAAAETIADLDPRPGQAFQPAEQALYVRPDVFVVVEDGKPEIVLNEYYLPKITVSDYYLRLLGSTDEEETRTYLRQKMRQAQWLLDSLSRRGSTLRRCAEAVLEAQLPFFQGRTGELAPMNLRSLASALELHPSTVSRAVRGKYLQCRQGTYPLRYFFNRAVGPGGHSRQAVKQRILELVAAEDPRRPLSDQRLCALLAEEGVQAARRTVAKYRMELGIGSSAARKRLKRG